MFKPGAVASGFFMFTGDRPLVLVGVFFCDASGLEEQVERGVGGKYRGGVPGLEAEMSGFVGGGFWDDEGLYGVVFEKDELGSEGHVFERFGGNGDGPGGVFEFTPQYV